AFEGLYRQLEPAHEQLHAGRGKGWGRREEVQIRPANVPVGKIPEHGGDEGGDPCVHVQPGLSVGEAEIEATEVAPLFLGLLHQLLALEIAELLSRQP
ncbi:hypothetical protein NGA_2074700, partial [Nannochloropsis gaditana CCMP526]|uniref:uncharacterized protein n=1 Tax=Nannochloropsis gaditana (strain CCMP526) TaxID=1093141 RepID=UPI00029F75EC